MNTDKRETLDRYVKITQLAKFVGVERAYTSKIINGTATPSVELANQLAIACNMFCQTQGYFTTQDFRPGFENITTSFDDQRIASLEVEIAQRIHMIDKIRRESDPTAKGMLDMFSAFHRICTIVEGLKG